MHFYVCLNGLYCFLTFYGFGLASELETLKIVTDLTDCYFRF
jgi:hypothetical protein